MSFAVGRRNSPRSVQSRLSAYTTKAPKSYDNIQPSGDPLLEKPPDAPFLRIAYQNIRGATSGKGFELPVEITAMSELGIDIMGMSETNKPWTAGNKHEYDTLMRSCFRQSQTLYSSAPVIGSTKYQPGGNALTLTGRTTGRISTRGQDEHGRFCWCTLRGRRDEGILLVSAYRVCHEAHDAPGPLTAFQQQYAALRAKGIEKPNPRRQILTDILTIITHYRALGFRPIVMLDANGDYRSLKDPDKDLASFLHNASLADPFHERFHTSPRTTAYGTKRIDYIFVDRALSPSILRIGYLGSHQGAFSDHSLAYADFDETRLFQGVINRPVSHHSREILLEQTDKIQAFLDDVIPRMTSHAIPARTTALATLFTQVGATEESIHAYNSLYKEFLDAAKASSKKVGRKKFGYMRSSDLTTKGRTLLLFKRMLDCKRRRAAATPFIINQCEALDIDPGFFAASSERDLRLAVRDKHNELWDSQKNGESLRLEWLRGIAQDRARVAGETDWEPKMKKMIRTAKENAVNRKLSIITKGQRGVMDRIQIPAHDWFFSPRNEEVYHYSSGVFEAYPSADDGTFYPHHTLKILPSDAVAVEIAQDPHTRHRSIIAHLPIAPILWRDITTQEEMETLLLERNQRHLEQTAREEGLSTVPPLSFIRRDHGINRESSQILDGTVSAFDLTPEMAAFFSALKRGPTEVGLPRIIGHITPAEIQSMFRHSKEKTSSDSRTLNYTLWKSMAKNDGLAIVISTLLSLPFTYGFPNAHWTHMTDFMLEKKPGVRQIHTLRIIGKVAAEFNTCLKFLIGHKAMRNFEVTDACDEQHGFRPNRSSIDAAMLKLLTFDSARTQRCTVGMIQHDMTAHFDRMYPEMTNIYASRYGVDTSILLSISKTIASLSRNVETAMGVSSGCYRQLNNAPRLGGMVQGKADVPQLSTQQSDAMLKAHKALSRGLCIYSPSMTRSIRHHSIAFADDTDGHVSTPTGPATSIMDTVSLLQHSAQTWSTLVNICGGLVALHKCNWQLIAWRDLGGVPTLVETPSLDLFMHDGKGARARVDYLPPDKPNVGLGYLLCPNGNQFPQFASLYESIGKLCNSVATAHLTEAETRLLLRQRIVPKFSYVLHTTSFSRAMCRKFDALLRRAIVPKLRLNRHYPGAILYGPAKYGGMEFPNIYTLQLQTQLQYLIKQLRWNKTVANDIKVAVETLQLSSGLTTPILEYVDTPIVYLDTTFFLDLRRRLAEVNASLWIEDIWTPALQRDGDSSLMGAFTSIPRVTAGVLRRANAVRLYLRVVTIADLADPTGLFIPDGMLTGDWQAGSDLLWPYQPKPPKVYWATFRRCLRLTFCTTTPSHERPANGMTLDTRLGTWHAVARNTWFPVYRSADKLYYREADTIRVLTMAQTSGFFHFEEETNSIPLHAHPITYKQIGQSIWTRRRHDIWSPETPRLPPGHILHNTLCNPRTDVLHLGSDGSVRLADEVATCAWMVMDTDSRYMQACFLLRNINSITSYRSELEGIYRGLRHIQFLDLNPVEIQQWCDSKSAVDNSNRDPPTPGAMIAPDADIILAIRHLRMQMDSSEITCRHVYGHQDSRRRGTPSTPTTGNTPTSHSPAHLSREAIINIECDRIANETALAALERNDVDPGPTIDTPLPGSRACLRIGRVWITTSLSREIMAALHTPSAREYCSTKYGWTTAVMNTVHWELIRLARRRGNPTKFMHTSKLLHGWLPVMQMHGHTTGVTVCPGCGTPSESVDHLFECPHPLMRSARDTSFLLFSTKCRRMDLPLDFFEAFSGYVRWALTGDTRPITNSTTLAYAIRQQDQIGRMMILRGFLAKGWAVSLLRQDVMLPHQTLAKILRLIWDIIVAAIWAARNDILHHQANHTATLEFAVLGTRLTWFLANKLEAISFHDRFLVNYDQADIEGMSFDTRQALVSHLEVAHSAYRLELLQMPSQRNRITHYFARS